MLRLRDGVHLHQKQQNKKIKRRGVKIPCLSIFGDGAQLCPKVAKKNWGAKLCEDLVMVPTCT
jgi:hypothetical protein